ncbi:MAG: S-layer homology domain-containing protein [Oscillospiraceae bacterium]|nr:S-layer homology domain-containing protein [Oscillospiraceae bacterium]
MRNLKRAFSLVLALVMVLSVMTIAPVAAADETAPATVTSNFTDAAEIKYTEAVAITGGIGLFAGADGKFMPKGTVTRAQMATIIVKMLYGGDVNADSFKGSGKFIDTAYFEGGWAEGYINWCATLGIVAGYGDGTFKPGNQVTTAEAATMILNALKIDAGEGTWPNTVMAKAEEEDFFEDLKPMPGTNTALTREELAVIALNGLNWTPTDETGWYVSGGTADEKMTFESYKDASVYAGKVGGQVQPLEGRDSLANKVYELKKATGFITANQATGEKYTEVTLDWAGPATAKFNVTTDANMIGHKVEVWYQETYTSEREPGMTYAVSEAAEYITLAEDAETAKEYKAAFGTKYDMPVGGVAVTNGTGYVAGGQTIAGYVANSYAPAGTYAIDLESGNLCGYIAPAAYTVAKVGYVDTTPDNEMILVGSLSLSNNAEDDEVVEYEGIAKDDYVVYFRMQDVYVLAKMEMVTGKITKVRTEDGKKIVTLDGKEYTQSTATGAIANTLTAANLGSISYEEVYTFYLDPNGDFVCYEVNEGGTFDMANTFYVLGVMSRDDTDSYGKTTTTYFARGIDMTGNEAMVPIGVTTPSGEYGTKTIAEDDTFYSVEDNTDSKETKEYGLKKLVGFPGAYNADDPTAAYTFKMTSYGRPASETDWWPGGQFEYGVAEQLSNNGTFEAGVYCYNHKGTKYIVVEGNETQDYPLETAVFTGSGTFKFASQVNIRILVTRQANGTNNIEAMVFPMDVDHGVNATMIYVDKDHTTPAGTDTVGNVYEVHDALTGAAMEITVADTIDTIPVGFYSVGYDADEELYKLAVDGSGVPIKAPAADTETKFEQRDRTDGRYFESVVYGTTPTAYNGSTLWYNVGGSVWSSVCSGVKVVDPRTDEQVAESGVARITTLDQVWALKDSMPWVNIELDMCHTYSPSKIVTIFVEVYNNREYGIGNLVYADSYNDTTVIVVDGELDGMGKIINLPAGVVARKPGFYYLNANGAEVTLSAANLDTVSKVALNGNTDGLSGYEVFNATDIAALDTLSGFAGYEAVEYQLLPLAKKGTTVILVMGAGAKTASGNTAEKMVSAAEYDSVVDTTDNGITLANLESMQGTLCIEYDAYALNGGRMLMVATGTDAGTLVNTKTALDAVDASVSITNATDADFDTLAELKTLVDAGYTFSAKLYDLPGGKVLVVSMCTNAAAVGGTLTAADFAGTGKVVLTGDVTLSGAIAVDGNWTIDLNGHTLTAAAAPYFTVASGKTLTIMDSGANGTIQGIENGTDAMIRVTAGGTVNLEGGTLTGHTNTASTGGAIGVQDGVAGAQINVYGGAITNNTAKRGGGISVGDGGDSDLLIAGGTISGNVSTDSPNYGGIYSHTGSFNITGGTISDTICWRFGTGTSTISGNPVISSLNLANGSTSTIGGLTAGADVTTTVEDALTVTDTTVAHAAGTKAYTAASGGLDFKVVQPANGTIALTPAVAELGDTVTVVATPDTGYELKTVYVDGEAITGTTFTATKEHRVTAEFAPIDYTVSVDPAITGGTVAVDPTTANIGDTVTVTATPATGKELHKILVNGFEITGTTFEMPAEDVEVSAVFGDVQYNITKAPVTGGTVAVAAKAVADATVTITTTTSANYRLTAVQVNGGAVAVTDKGDGEYEFTMPAADVTVSATFVAGVAYEKASAADVPTGTFTVEDTTGNGLTPANLATKVEENDINFTVFGDVVVVTYFDAGKSVALTQTTGEVVAGKYYLTGDLALTGTLNTKTNNVTIDLNGYNITGATFPMISIGNGVASSTVVIKDSKGTGSIKATAANTNNDVYGMIFVTSGTLKLESGKLTGYKYEGTSDRGGAVALINNANFIMTGGEISGNKGRNGGGVTAQGTNTITISGGSIVNNEATAYGGAIYAKHSGVTINISGGTISGTANKGGAICSAEAWANSNRVKLNISGGTISGTATTAACGAIGGYAMDFTMTGGEITSGNSWFRHAGVKISGGTFVGSNAALNVRPDVGTSELCYVEITGNAKIGYMSLSMNVGTHYVHHATIGNLTAGASVRDALKALTASDTTAKLTGDTYTFNG